MAANHPAHNPASNVTDVPLLWLNRAATA